MYTCTRTHPTCTHMPPQAELHQTAVYSEKKQLDYIMFAEVTGERINRKAGYGHGLDLSIVRFSYCVYRPHLSSMHNIISLPTLEIAPVQPYHAAAITSLATKRDVASWLSAI